MKRTMAAMSSRLRFAIGQIMRPAEPAGVTSMLALVSCLLGSSCGQALAQDAQNAQNQQQSQSTPSIGYEILQLSYIDTDHAIALLKAIGYTTVEYSQQEGETAYDKIYSPVRNGEWRLPVVVKLIDATKTSLQDPSPVASLSQQRAQGYSTTYSTVPDIGGTFLHQMTSGEPQQRLLILYDQTYPAPKDALLDLLKKKIDLPARQIVIEALVIEINTNKVKDLGVTLRAAKDDIDVSFEQDSKGEMLPLTFTFNRDAYGEILYFRNSLKALVKSGDAQILSNPSVLVLDGRQARIQVGQQVPVVRSTATAAGITSSVEYFPVGIVLNLRPRLSEDGSEVTMQVETIVSAISRAIGSASEASQVFFAPTVDNRQVQTFVRVADNTPFIVGGLISTDKQDHVEGIPFLSRIPILGMPFQRKVTDNSKKEVIVVLTPHVAPVQEKSFSYLIPKDSDVFDSFGNSLSRNAYRVRDTDVFDLKFIYESEIFQDLLQRIKLRTKEEPGVGNAEPFASLLQGAVPGEEILVRRMLWEIVRKTHFEKHVDPSRIIFFEDTPGAPDSTGFRLSYLAAKLVGRDSDRNALVLSFKARPEGTPEHPFVQPKAQAVYEHVNPNGFDEFMMRWNSRSDSGDDGAWTIVIPDTPPPGVPPPLELLKGVLVLKRVLALNSTLPLTVREFHVGRQIIFPTEEDIHRRFHVIDRDVARFFYETIFYYPAFEREFNRQTRMITEELRKSGR